MKNKINSFNKMSNVTIKEVIEAGKTLIEFAETAERIYREVKKK